MWIRRFFYLKMIDNISLVSFVRTDLPLNLDASCGSCNDQCRLAQTLFLDEFSCVT